MTNRYLTAAENARRLLANFELVKQVAEAFELVGTLEQATGEARAAHEAALAPLQQALADRQEAEGQAANARADADAVLFASAAAKEAALVEATRIVAEANAQAHDIVTQARRVSAADIEDAAERVKAAGITQAAVLVEVEALQAKLDTLKEQATKLLG